jgi:hypothetical protein
MGYTSRQLNLAEIKRLLDENPSFKAMLMGDATDQSSIIPHYTTTQRDALAAAARPEGMLIYNTTTHKLNVRTASAWEAVTSA